MAGEERFDPDNEAESLGADEEYEARVEGALSNLKPKGNLRTALKIMRGGWGFERTPNGGLRVVFRKGKV